MGDQPAGGLEDLPGAAPVEVEDDGAAMPKSVPKPLQDRGVGAGPGEDRLLVVAHGEAVPVPGGELGDDLVLGQAQVLELVHQHVVPAAAHVRQRIRRGSGGAAPVRAIRSS